MNDTTNTKVVGLVSSLLQTAKGSNVVISESAKRKSESMFEGSNMSNIHNEPYDTTNTKVVGRVSSLLQTAKSSNDCDFERSCVKAPEVLKDDPQGVKVGHPSLDTEPHLSIEYLSERNYFGSIILKMNFLEEYSNESHGGCNHHSFYIDKCTKRWDILNKIHSFNCHKIQLDVNNQDIIFYDSNSVDSKYNHEIDMNKITVSDSLFSVASLLLRKCQHLESRQINNSESELIFFKLHNDLKLKHGKSIVFSNQLIDWLRMQLRWLVWTFACYERKYPTQYFGGLLNYDNLLTTLNFRLESYVNYRNFNKNAIETSNNQHGISIPISNANIVSTEKSKSAIKGYKSVSAIKSIATTTTTTTTPSNKESYNNNNTTTSTNKNLMTSRSNNTNNYRSFHPNKSMSPLQRCYEIRTFIFPMVFVFCHNKDNITLNGQDMFQVTDGWW